MANDEGKSSPSGCAACIQRFDHGLDSAFYSIGYRVANRPWLHLLLAILVALAMSAGFSFRVNETDQSRLWVPRGAPSLSHKRYVSERWPASTAFHFLVGLCAAGDGADAEAAAADGCNVLTLERVRAWMAAEAAVAAIAVDGDAVVAQFYANHTEATEPDDGGTLADLQSDDFAPTSAAEIVAAARGVWTLEGGPVAAYRSVTQKVANDGPALVISTAETDDAEAVDGREDSKRLCARAGRFCLNHGLRLIFGGQLPDTIDSSAKLLEVLS